MGQEIQVCSSFRDTCKDLAISWERDIGLEHHFNGFSKSSVRWDVIQCANIKLDLCFYKYRSNAVKTTTIWTLHVTATWVYSPFGTRSCGTDSKEINHWHFDRVSWFLRAQGHMLTNKRARDTGYQCYRFRWHLNRLHWSNILVTVSYVKRKKKRPILSLINLSVPQHCTNNEHFMCIVLYFRKTKHCLTIMQPYLQ